MRSVIPAFLVVLTALLLSSCAKDVVSDKYVIFRPVYKTKQEVINNIKSTSPINITATGKLFVRGNYVFLNDINKGVHVIDYSNPSSPTKVSFIAIPGNVDLAVRGNILYADCYTDLIVIDISNPLQVEVKKVMPGVFPHRQYDGFSADTSKVIVEWKRIDTTVTREMDENWRHSMDGLVVPFNSLATGGSAAPTQNGVGGSMARFALLGNRLYTVGDHALKVFNTTIAQDASYVTTVQLPSWDIENIFPFQEKLFIGSRTGMYIYSVVNPDNPVQQGTFNHVRVCDPVIADNDHAFVTLRSGTPCQGFTNQLEVLSIQNIMNPVLLKTYQMVNPHGLSKDGNLLFICDGSAGLKIFDATNVQALTQVKHLEGLETFDVIALGGIALTVAKDGLYFIDYSQPSNIYVKGKLSTQ